MNRNPEVDAWFDGAGHPLEATMRRAREIMLEADGRVTESIKWKTPTFAYRGNIASFNPSKHLLSIMFHRGAEIPGEHPRLEGDGRLVRTMRFTDLADLEAGRGDLEAVVRAWCDWKGGSSGDEGPGEEVAWQPMSCAWISRSPFARTRGAVTTGGIPTSRRR